jgi:hypothetical protein
MADAGSIKKNSTLGSALLLLLLGAAIAAIVIFLLLNPEIITSLIAIAVIAVIIIVIAIVMIYVIMAILALPYYAAKGESYQTNASYDLDDVEPVKEKDSREEEDRGS